MKVSFVIPIYNRFSLINQLLVDINNHTHPDEVIVVDDCSIDPDTASGLAWWQFNMGTKVVRTPENYGFLKASNFGIEKATGDIVCLISSDVRIEDDLAKIVHGILELNSKCLIGGVVYTHDTGWNTFENRIYPYLEGWLLCCMKLAWTDLGGFDERYAPNDMEDVDLSTTAIEKGYSLIPLNNPRFRHLSGQTIGFNDERMALTIRNKEKFRSKWTQQPEQQA